MCMKPTTASPGLLTVGAQITPLTLTTVQQWKLRHSGSYVTVCLHVNWNGFSAACKAVIWLRLLTLHEACGWSGPKRVVGRGPCNLWSLGPTHDVFSPPLFELYNLAVSRLVKFCRLSCDDAASAWSRRWRWGCGPEVDQWRTCYVQCCRVWPSALSEDHQTSTQWWQLQGNCHWVGTWSVCCHCLLRDDGFTVALSVVSTVRLCDRQISQSNLRSFKKKIYIIYSDLKSTFFRKFQIF